ncbi:MAG TPA: helix-turn-helix transcriptional regulator [Nocardioides sp.]|nr:helix-turn-helix transcriptional regulator [Nocardioides sp.]
MSVQRPVSQMQFAADIGCHYTLVTRYRNGERLPTVEHLARMIETYDLDPMEAIKAVNKANERDAKGEKKYPKAFATYLRDNIFTAPPAAKKKAK